MTWSLYLGQLAGIKLFVHWTFLILIAWILLMHFQMGNGLVEGLVGVGFVILLFGCVILHELGHALTAKRYGIVTRNITILPIGGLAIMEQLPEKPEHELLVAIMGPAVNVVIALVLYIYLNAVDAIPTVEEVLAAQEAEHSILGGNYFLFNLFLANIMLVLFNLIPAFPMDGGRMLRAILSFSLSRLVATRIAARIGQLMAILFVFAGFYTNFWLVFIGIFIFLGAEGEARYEAARSTLSGHQVRDVLMSKFTILHPQDDLSKAMEALLDGQDQEFLVGEGNTVQGILTKSNIIKGLSEFGKDAPVSAAMQKEFTSLQPEMDLKQVYHKMVTGGFSVGPVFENGKLIGIVNRENINELIMVFQALDKDGA